MERLGAFVQSQVPILETHPTLAVVAIITMLWGAMHQAQLAIRLVTWVIQHSKREMRELWNAVLLLKREVTRWDPDKTEEETAAKPSLVPPTPTPPGS